MKKILSLLFILSISFLFTNNALALSDYGRKCDDNDDCISCRDKDLECLTCMHACGEKYGPAEVDIDKRKRDRDETCRIRWAKWCMAQCWDPDNPEEKENPDWIPTKPNCSSKQYPSYPDNNAPRPWE